MYKQKTIIHLQVISQQKAKNTANLQTYETKPVEFYIEPHGRRL